MIEPEPVEQTARGKRRKAVAFVDFEPGEGVAVGGKEGTFVPGK